MKPATRASRYATIKKLGEGGYGKALLVRNKDDKHLYVMKQVKVSNLSAKDKHAALHEATLLSAFNSPYIVKFTESFEEKGVLYIVMEYADGGDLCQMMERRKRSKKYFTEDEVLYYFIQISMALKYLHDRKVLHRDIKAQNVFLMKTGQVKLGDFGIAKVLQNTMALAMSQIGTPYYLSPEICNNRKYNSKTDIWSLGCMLYEMCTFTHPFDAKDVKSLMKRIIQAKYVPISSSRYSPELQALLSRLLNKNPNERPSINQVLGFPFIKIQLSNYLDKTIQNEMNHTILHGFRFDNQRPVNHPPEAPPKPVQQPPVQQKKAPAQPPRPQQKPFTPQIQQHPPNPAPSNAKPQTPGVRQSNNRNLPAKPQNQQQQPKPANQQNAAKPQQPVQKPAVQQNHPQQPQQQQKQPVQQPKAQPQQQNQVQHQRVVQQNQKVVVPPNQPQQAHSNNGNAKPPSNPSKRAQPPSARGSNAKKPANQQPKKTREEQIAEFKKYAAEREAKRLQQEREAQSKKNDEAEKKLSQQVAEAEAKVAGKKDSDPDKEKLKAKLEQIKALKKWSEERERIKKEQEAKRKQEEEEKQKKQQEEADRIKKEAEKIKQKRDDQKVKERQELKQKQQQRLQAAAAYRKQQDEEERQRLRHLEEEDEMQQQLESLMPDESKLPSWVNKPKLSAEEEELQMLSRKPLTEMSNEERARFAQLQRHEMRRNKEKGTAGTTETNDEDMNEYDEIDEDRQNEIQYEMAMSMNQALNLPEVNEDDKAEDGFESDDEDGKGPNPEMVLWESSDSEEDEEEDFPGPA